MRVRKTSNSDLRGLAKLNSEIFGDTSEKQALKVFKYCMKNQVPGACLLAEENGEVVGAVFTAKIVSFSAKAAMVKSIFVKEGYRGKEIGRELLERSIGAVKKAGIEDISLTVDKKDKFPQKFGRIGISKFQYKNKRAFALYRKLGFRPFRLLLLKEF